MLAQYLVDRVRKLIAEDKLSLRDIARKTGVGRGKVLEMALQMRLERNPYALNPFDDFEPPADAPVRCPTCGNIVFMPCLYCKMKTHSACGPVKLPTPRRSKCIVGLNLGPVHYKRYRFVRRLRRKLEAGRKTWLMKDPPDITGISPVTSEVEFPTNPIGTGETLKQMEIYKLIHFL